MLVKCKDCQGSGTIFVKINGLPLGLTCSTCHGKGGFDVPAGKELCPDCNGSKVITVQTAFGIAVTESCKTCFGTGFIDSTSK